MENRLKKLRAYCNAPKYDIEKLYSYIGSISKATLIKNVVVIKMEHNAEAHIFDYGVTVFWNADYDRQRFISDEIEVFRVGKNVNAVTEDFNFIIDEETQTFKVAKDKIALADDNNMDKLAVSHAVAQSTKLASFEDSISDVIKRNEHIPEELALTGKINLSRNKIYKETGKIFQERSKIYLNYGLLDIPEFFWEYPELENIYNAMANYLEIKPRIDVLNKKLEALQDIVTMLRDEQNHKHSSFLEWVIIILIAAEILLTIFMDGQQSLLKLFN